MNRVRYTDNTTPREPGSEGFTASARSPPLTTSTTTTTTVGDDHDDTSNNSRGGGVLVLQAPLQPAQRRRSSSISFERHDLSVFADFLSREDIDDDDDDSSTESSTTVDSSDDEEDEAEENNAEEEYHPGMEILRVGSASDIFLNREIHTAYHRRPSAHRRTSEISMDLEDIREAAAEFEDDDEDEEEDKEENENPATQENDRRAEAPSVSASANRRSTSSSSHHSSSSSAATTLFGAHLSHSSLRSRGASTSTASSIIGRIEEEILAKAVQSGKIVVGHGPGHNGHHNSLINGRGGGGGGRRSSHSSWSSGHYSHRRISFSRPVVVEVTASPSPSSAAAFGEESNERSRTVQDDIATALKELRELDCNDDDEDDGDDGKDDVPKKGNDPKGDKNALLDLRDVSKPAPGEGLEGGKTGGDEAGESETPEEEDAGAPRALAVKVVELLSPPPRGTTPRRSSLRTTRRPEHRAHHVR